MNILNALNSIASITPTPFPSSSPTLTPTPPPLPLPSTAPTQSPSPVRTQGKISGSVVNIKGNPIESVKIKLKGITTKTLFTTLSDADGFFEFTGLEADTYSTIANKKGFKKSSKTVVLEEGEEKEIEIKMRKAKRIRITMPRFHFNQGLSKK